MKIIYNRLIPWKGYIGINLCGIIFARSEYKNRLPSVFYNHEYIHTLQMKRDGYVRFYYRYLREFVRNYKRTSADFGHGMAPDIVPESRTGAAADNNDCTCRKVSLFDKFLGGVLGVVLNLFDNVLVVNFVGNTGHFYL